MRGEQARIKGGRGKTLDQVKLMQDNVGKKVSSLGAEWSGRWIEGTAGES